MLIEMLANTQPPPNTPEDGLAGLAVLGAIVLFIAWLFRAANGHVMQVPPPTVQPFEPMQPIQDLVDTRSNSSSEGTEVVIDVVKAVVVKAPEDHNGQFDAQHTFRRN